MTTLLEKAERVFPQYVHNNKKVSSEEAEVLIAFLKGKISHKQAKSVLDIDQSSKFYSWVMKSIKILLAEQRLDIIVKK
uniref:Uncharacterized protein n=1 Tax=viral metagenome TaxID=1070528 RepID=A0A6M3JYW2_9ZZZZ